MLSRVTNSIFYDIQRNSFELSKNVKHIKNNSLSIFKSIVKLNIAGIFMIFFIDKIWAE